MQQAMKITHVVVDGSNIATEGRDAPSLAQLDEAVQAFVEEYGPKHVTVVVDATFPNRIARKERETYEQAVNANELITPPAGAIGRGDAFVLQIAKRAGAAILSNDSFQEFHGDYPWLFDRGRLIGGKPVPHVGWVFMDRAPVRGPTSRRAVSEAKKMAKAAEQAAEHVVADLEGAEAAAPPPRRRRSKARAATPAPEAAAASGDGQERAAPAPVAAEGAQEAGGRTVAPYNEALPFIEFVAQHPVGSEVDATIERFSSHGAYVTIGAARGYVPLGNLADPAPRSAKEVLRVGEERRLVVVAIDPPRRGIDLAVPGVVDVPAPDLADAAHLVAELAIDVTDAAEEIERAADEIDPAGASARKATARKATARKATAKTGARRSSAKKAAAQTSTADEPRASKATDRKATAKKASARKATGKTTAAKKATARGSSTPRGEAEPADEATPGPESPAATAAEGGEGPAATARKKASAKRATSATRKATSKRVGPSSEADAGEDATVAPVDPQVAKRTGRARKAAAESPVAPAPAPGRAARSATAKGSTRAAGRTAASKASKAPAAKQGASRRVARGGGTEPAASDGAAPAQGDPVSAPTGA
jgi:hypothetical protein